MTNTLRRAMFISVALLVVSGCHGSISGRTDGSVPSDGAVTGDGPPADAHRVELSWTASTSTVVGYTVHRGAQAGGPYTSLNDTPNPAVTYVDYAVEAGQTYYYVVKAVDSTGAVSDPSNEVAATIPTP